MIIGVEQSAVWGDEGHLGGGGAGVDAQPGVPAVGGGVHLGGMVGIVPGQEGVVLRLTGKEGGHGVYQPHVVHTLFQKCQRLVKGALGVVGGAQGRAHGGEAVAVLREDGMLAVQMQGLHEPLPQTVEEVEGTAQKDDLSLELPALGEPGHGLVHHGLKDRGGHVLLPPALVEDGLNVAFGEYAAAGGDGVDFLVLEREAVQLVDGDVHQGGHLVDESAGAAGAGAVHTLLQRTAEKDDLGVFATQLDDGVGARYVGVDGGRSGVDLLHKVDAGGLGHAQSGGPGDDQAHVLARQLILNGMEGLAGPFPGLGVMPLVRAEKKLVLLIQHHNLYSGGADVDANAKAHRFTSYAPDRVWKFRWFILFVPYII